MLSTNLKIKDLGATQSILGIEVIRNSTTGTLQLRQKGLIDEIITNQYVRCETCHDTTPSRTVVEGGKLVPHRLLRR